MGMLSGLAPWIAYWVLVGNVPFPAAALAALAITAVAVVVGSVAGKPERTLEFGSAAVFVVLTGLSFARDEWFAQRWMLPLSAAGFLVVALVGTLTGKPFVRAFAAAEQPADVAKTELFGRLVSVLSWVWVGTAAAMTVSSAIPPMVRDDATILDTKTPLSYVCYWLIPFTLLGLAALASRFLPDRMLAGIGDVPRETSFVAYDEATIDELYFLAQEHANREVGPGKEAYNVKVGGMGVPLTGDESRKSWPSTYKVRDKRR
ncbi:hypothetical protein A5750_06350 [Mycobacterium sp. 852002-51613_SCH5001154]|uniref:hypothetical protein n=1 Tax=Mycobacterium sp. 852002-51613_SCH5001154 TaxID=1834104 RepID=UPI000801B552|nr:hypothetical protein [Mycobacterium sp. 852002-51613_SCH5001154]OBF77532.1 hypothetical protein A5750_06350 [Mycobacterium sp. 852002-51613_SCH5001154]